MPAEMRNEQANRFPPLRFLGPSFGIGSALTTLEGGGAARRSMCFSILSLKLSPKFPVSPVSLKKIDPNTSEKTYRLYAAFLDPSWQPTHTLRRPFAAPLVDILGVFERQGLIGRRSPCGDVELTWRTLQLFSSALQGAMNVRAS